MPDQIINSSNSIVENDLCRSNESSGTSNIFHYQVVDLQAKSVVRNASLPH